MKIIGIGDNVVDYYLDRGEIYPGGNAVNVAVLAKQYGAEKSAYIGIIGNDAAGTHVLDSLNKETVDTARIRVGQGANWESIVALDEEADRIFVGSNRETNIQSVLKLHFNPEDISYIRNYDIMHTSMYSKIENELAELKEYITISYDFSSDTDDAFLAKVCPHIKYAFFSGSELDYEECVQLAKRAAAYGAEIIGITRGSLGALFFRRGTMYHQSITETEVIDTLGAGDSFIAMFLTMYEETNDMPFALAEASKAAAQICTRYGAFGSGLAKVRAE